MHTQNSPRSESDQGLFPSYGLSSANVLMCTPSLTVIPRDNLLKKRKPREYKRD